MVSKDSENPRDQISTARKHFARDRNHAQSHNSLIALCGMRLSTLLFRNTLFDCDFPIMSKELLEPVSNLQEPIQ